MTKRRPPIPDDDALSALSLYKDYLKDDPKKETYKIHMLVPVQVLQMLKENESEETG